MTKLPKVFHDNNIISNNKKSFFNTFVDKVEEKKIINYSDYLMKDVSIYLIKDEVINGIVVSVQKDYLLLDNGIYVYFKDIKDIK